MPDTDAPPLISPSAAVEVPSLDVGVADADEISAALLFLEAKCGKNVWDIYEYLRSEIWHEHGLLSGRVAWFITCQSFLLTTYGISYSNSHGANWFSNIALPALACIVSALAYFMIAAASQTVGMWRAVRDLLIQKYMVLDPLFIERLRSTNQFRNDAVHRRAALFPVLMPVIFILFWFFLALVSWQLPWIVRA